MLLGLACLLLGLATAGLAAAQGPSGSASLTGWLGNGTTFPQRALVLLPPRGAKLSPATVHVTENGAPVGPLTVSPSTQPAPRDLGVMVLLDRSRSMRGAPLAAATSALRSLVSRRQAQEELGLIGFDTTSTVLLPLTSDPAAISRGLAKVPSAGGGTDVPAAVTTGLAQLAKAQVALGAIVIVSDGVGQPAQGGAIGVAAQAEATAAHVPIFTVGVKDRRATPSSLAALAKVLPGQFEKAPPSHLASVLKQIEAAVTRGYVVRWRSASHSGRPVAIGARVDGVAGSVATSAAPAPVSHRPPAPSTRPAHAAQPTPLVTTGHLSSAPSFGPPATSAQTGGGSTVPNPALAAVTHPVATGSFWASPKATLVVAGLCGLLVALAVLCAFYRPSRRAVRVRVGSYLPSPESTGLDLLTGESAGRRGGLIKMFENGRWWPAFVEDVGIARSPHTPAYLVKRAALIGVGAAALITVFSGSMLFGLAPLLGWPIALRQAIKRNARKQRDVFRETLPGYLQDLASAMRVGRSFIGGLTAVAETADEPTRSELDRAITDEALGRPLDESLEAVAARMEAPDVSQVALIAALNRRSGSNVSEALDRVAEGARERADLRREVRALTAQAKMSSLVLTALPGVMFVGMNLVSPVYARPLLHSTIGIVLMFVGTGMVFAGWKVMSKITNVEV